MKDFVHLHVHTEFSLLDGACRITRMMEHLKSIDQRAVAITDHGVMYGAVDFYKAAKDAGIKPIIGCELYVAPRTMADKTYELDSDARHLVMLCKNRTGYKNLIYLCSKGFTDGFYVHPRVDFELLSQYSEGLVALSACLAGEVQQLLMQDNFAAAKECALKYDALFGRGNYYLELQDHGIPEQRIVNKGLLQIAGQTGIPLVATNDAHYIKREDARMHDVLLCIQTGRTVDDDNRMRFSGDGFYLKSGDEMAELFSYAPEAIENTVKIAEMCNFDFEFGNYHLPHFELPDGETDAFEYLCKLARSGLVQRYKNPTEEHEKRLEYELNMIRSTGFVDYFLIVYDFIAFAYANKIPVGPGRGSGAGSIVAYSLFITGVDPIKYALFFERFLNPERISMPDFDIDFCPNRRQEVIDYVTQKYGSNQVAQIVTFGTMAARAAVRDTGRALNMPYAEVDVIAKLIPQELKITLDKALEISPDLKRYYNDDERVKALIDMARKLEGMPRNASTHAAGVIIAAAPVYEYVPLSKGDQGVVTQFPMTTLEELGLLKMDFLGLRNLTVIDDAIKMINAGGANPPIDLDTMDYEDAAVFQMLSKGHTSGVFQMESGGMTGVAIGLKPRSVEDITAIIALFRPGPMQKIPLFIECSHNPEKVSYKHPLLKSILEVTYGVIVYQEQVMAIVRVLAGYSVGRADVVRYAMSKKKMKELVREREIFIHGNAEEGIKGCVANGVSEKIANELFDEMLDFANYAFNKAHAVSYAVISYQTAWLKFHYPKEYMAALLTSVLGASSKISEYISQCRELGITVLPPDVNESRADFTVSGGNIRFGIGAVKNVGYGFIEKLVYEREKNGEFLSFDDFCTRMSRHDLNKRVLESLIKCGAFDGMGLRRSALMSVYMSVLDSASSDKQRNISGQINLFLDFDSAPVSHDSLPDLPEYSRRERLSQEREVTGLYLSGHPMEDYVQLAKQVGATPVSSILALMDSEIETNVSDGSWLTIAGVISSVRIKVTKKQTTMAYIALEDLTGAIEMLAFDRMLSASGSYLKEDSPVIVYGRVSAREDEEPKIICEDIYPLDEQYAANWREIRRKAGQRGRGANAAPPQSKAPEQRLHLRVPYIGHPCLDAVFEILRQSPGRVEVYIYGEQDGRRVRWDKARVGITDVMLDELERILSRDNVTVK